MNPSDEGYRAFLKEDWKTASSEFTKKVKKLKKREGHEQRFCEVLVYAAVSTIYVNSDKADQVFRDIEKSFRTDETITKKILHHIVNIEFLLINLTMHKFYWEGFNTQ